jgi:hypothetical protein
MGPGCAGRPPYEATVVVPCWNEEAGVPSLIGRLDLLIVEGRRPWEVVFVDDGSRDKTAELLEDACLIAALGRGADVVTGSPWHPDNQSAEGGWLRLVLSRGVSRIYRWIAGTEIHTFTCLFRAHRREVVEQVTFAESGFAAITEILIRAILRGYRVVEVPMPLTARRQGTSKMSIAAAIGGHLELLVATARLVRSTGGGR